MEATSDPNVSKNTKYVEQENVNRTKRSNLWLYLPVSVAVSCLGAALCVQAVSVRRGGASASFAQHHADLRIHQQSYDEGNIE